MGWKPITFGEILANIIGGGTPSKANPEYWNGNIPWASVKDMKEGRYRLSQTGDYITKEGLDNSATNLIPKGTVIISTRMGLGRVFMNDVDMAINQDLKALFPKQGVCNEYLLWLIAANAGLLESLGSGTTVKGIRLEQLRAVNVLLPPLPTQRKIAAILSAYDDLIENNLRRIKILEEMAQNLYREWFVKFRFPGHQQTRFTDSPLGGIPEGWNCGVVNDLLSLKSGFAFKSNIFTENGTYGLVTIKNVHDGHFVPECTSRIAGLPSNMPSYCHLSTGDVLLSLTGNIGRVCLVYGTDYLLNQRVAKLVPIVANDRAYIYFTFRQDEFQTRLSKIANGVAQQNLSPIEAGRMQVVIPSQKVLSDFAGICEPIVEEMTVLSRKNTTLRCTRDLLLPRLMSGEVDVSELDITVPEEGA